MRVLLSTALVMLCACSAAAQSLAPGTPLPVRILYDHSGSMYPGYRPPGVPDRRTRSELGVGYVHESPRFRAWLADFVERQTIVDAASVGMWTCTSNEGFTPFDIREAHPVVDVARFDATAAIAAFPAETGRQTYLTEAVDAFTRNFTGLVWLITDNIVETNEGQPDAGVQAFFETLAGRPEIRAVHLFKYTFDERGHTAALAVYGMLVSLQDVPPATLGYYDGKFRMLRDAKRRDGDALFPGREYLKLKDLSVGPLHPELRLVLEDADQGLFKEGQTVKLGVEGAIRSYLTQHSVTAGRYELAIASPFEAEEWARLDLGAQAMEPERFETFSAELDATIPPAGSREVKASLESRQPIQFSPRSPVAWLRLAWNGATVRYNGTVRMSFTDVRVRLEPQRMAGIFGIDRATSAFAFQDVKTLPDVPPTRVPVSFALRTGSSRTLILLVILAILAAIACALAFLLSRKRTFRVAVSREPEAIVALRPLGGHNVMVDGRVVGRLKRGLGSYAFQAATGDPAITVTPSKDADVWDVNVSGTSRRLSIKAEGGGAARPQKAPAMARAAPAPPPPPVRSAPPPPPGRPPRIGRN